MSYQQKHYLYFDGTSYFVDDESYMEDLIEGDDFEIIKTGYDLDSLCEEADELNESITY